MLEMLNKQVLVLEKEWGWEDVLHRQSDRSTISVAMDVYLLVASN